MFNFYDSILLIFILTIQIKVIKSRYNVKIILLGILINITLFTLLVLNFKYAAISYIMVIFLLFFGAIDLLIFYIYILTKFSMRNLKLLECLILKKKCTYQISKKKLNY